MRIVVCPLHELDVATERHRPSHVLTMLAPDAEIQPLPAIPQDQRLALLFHDIIAPTPGLIAPDEASIASILGFSAAWDRRDPMVIHCWAGVSRSPAAAYIVACQHSPAGREAELAQRLRNAAPHVTPNALMVAIADALLQRDGRMVSAIAAIGRGTDCFTGEIFVLPWREGTS